MKLLALTLGLLFLCGPAKADSDEPGGVSPIGVSFEMTSGPPDPDANTVFQLVPWTFKIVDAADTDMITFQFANTITPFNPHDPLIIRRLAFEHADADWNDAEHPDSPGPHLWTETVINGQDWIVPAVEQPGEVPEPSTLATFGAGLMFLSWVVLRRKGVTSSAR